MEIWANFENGACQWWSEEDGQGDKGEGDTWQDCCEARHVKKFLTSGLEACLLSLSLAPARQHIFHSPLDWAGGVGSGGGFSGCCCTLHSWTGGRTGLETFMNYGCQFFLRCCVLRPGEEALSLALIFWKYFSAHSTISFLAFFLLSSLGAGGWRVWVQVCCLRFFPLNAS